MTKLINSIYRTLIEGDKEAGFTVFWADEGLDTGPILLQQKCDVNPDDTVDTLYSRFLYPAGIKAMASVNRLICQTYKFTRSLGQIVFNVTLV